MMKYVAQLEYLGTNYNGWQKQKHLSSTIQTIVEDALSQVFSEQINTICAGRTDAGVHARCQIVNFESKNQRSINAILLGVNGLLPPDISFKSARIIENDDFNARFSARLRHYKYLIYNAPTKSPLQFNRALWCHMPLDINAMNLAANYLLGENDFSAFRSRYCQARNTYRTVYSIDITRDNEFICIDLKANAFLHSMVRKIVGSLLLVGQVKKEPVWLKEVLDSKDRSKSGRTAEACGLYLWDVEY